MVFCSHVFFLVGFECKSLTSDGGNRDIARDCVAGFFALDSLPPASLAPVSQSLILSQFGRMTMVGQLSSVFWRSGLVALVLVAVSTLSIRLCGPESTVALLLLPVFFLLFQIPYVLFAMITEGKGVFRPLLFGSPWLVIPFWGVLVFLWNGSLAALLSFGYARLTKRV